MNILTKHNFYGVAIVIGLILGAAIVVDFGRADPSDELDAVTLCPVRTPVPHHTILLVDRTDAFSPRHARQLVAAVARIKTSVPVRGRITVHLIEGDAFAAQTPVLDICNPGDGSTVNPIETFRHIQQEEYNSRFDAPLTELVESLLNIKTADESPILESIALVTETFDARTDGRRIVVVSDLLEHTSEISHYRSAPDPADLGGALAFDLLSDGRLRGVEIEFVYLRRKETARLQTKRHIDWWNAVVAEAGATPAAESASTGS